MMLSARMRVPPAALQLLGYASAAQRAAGVSRLALMRFFGSCSRKIASHLARATRTPLPDRVQVFPSERGNVGQEGFNALVHRARLWPAP
jgi:hypothetical protein